MEKKKKIAKISIVVAIILILITLGTYLGYQKIYLPSKTEYKVKVFEDNELFLNELTFKEGSYIQVLDQNENAKKKINLNKDNKSITLENVDNIDNLIFDTWEIEKKTKEKDKFYKNDIIYFNAKPIYHEKDDFVLNFLADKKATILSKGQEVTYLKKPYKVDTSIIDYLPEVNTEKDYKGDWVVEDTKIDKDTKIEKDSILKFKTYQDKNDNKIDDFTEEFTVDFITNIEQEVDPKVVKWEETIELPILEDESKIFYEWYVDKEYKREFTEKTKVVDNLTLYAKVKSFKEIINDTIEDPIDRKDIAMQVEQMLEKRNQNVNLVYNQEVEEKEKERKALKEYNEENKVVTQNVEVEINLHNMEHNKIYLINFVDTSNNFIYSLVAPYGQTIKVLTDNGSLYQEYGVRHNTTIVLDEKKLISSENNLEKYHSEYREINDTVFIKIQPITN